jgi:hypothetical protein
MRNNLEQKQRKTANRNDEKRDVSPLSPSHKFACKGILLSGSTLKQWFGHVSILGNVSQSPVVPTPYSACA